MQTILRFFSIIFFLAITCLGCTKNETQPDLTYSTWGSQSEMQIIKPIISDFEQKNNVKIKLIHIPQNYFQKLHLLFASKQAPDIVFINNYYLPIYAKAGLLEDISKYFPDYFLDGIFFQNALDALSYNNIRYAIPRDISNMVIYYNKNLFDKKNIPYPHKNWRYKDLQELAIKLTEKDVWGIGLEENPIFWEPVLWSNGGGIFSQNKNFILNHTESKTALKYYVELITDKHCAPTKMQSANRTMAQMFLDQKIAMQISGRWLVPKYRQETNFDWDVINLPQGTKGSIAGSDSSGWAISKSAKNKKLAADFIRYMSSKDSVNKLAKSGLITPARKDSAYSNAFLDGQPPENAKVFLEINENAITTPIPENYNQKIERLTKILEPYFSGAKKITPSTSFEL